MDIILLAILSAFIFHKLWSILGTRTGQEKKRDWSALSEENNETQENVIIFPKEKTVNPENNIKLPFEEDLKKLTSIDPSFSLESFTHGAERAFKTIVTAYAEANHGKLKKLLSEEVYEKFAQAIDKRQALNERLEVEISNIDAHILDIKVYPQACHIVTEIKSQQMLATINEQGQSYDNPARLIVPIINIWTFEKTIPTDSKVWTLIKTESRDPQ